MIRLEHIYKTYQVGLDAITVLRDITLLIKEGEFTAIVGKSGSGKSTLMNIIGLLDTSSSGNTFFDGIDIGNLSDGEKSHIRGQKIGFIFQNYGLIPRMPLIKQVMLPLAYQGVSYYERHRRALEALEKVGLIEHIDKSPDMLSGGQRQRVAIARALVIRPRLILADEPTGALDTKTGEEVIGLFHELHRLGSTIVLVTHSEDIARACERCVTLSDGIITSDTCISSNI